MTFLLLFKGEWLVRRLLLEWIKVLKGEEAIGASKLGRLSSATIVANEVRVKEKHVTYIPTLRKWDDEHDSSLGLRHQMLLESSTSFLLQRVLPDSSHL